jgi:hypothetical protein
LLGLTDTVPLPFGRTASETWLAFNAPNNAVRPDAFVAVMKRGLLNPRAAPA